MLFQEHGGQNDKDRQQIRGILDLPVFLQGLAVPDGNTDSDRVEYVDARQHVRGRIGSVNMSYQVYEYILPFKCNRTQVQPVGENRAQEQEERHPGDQERTQAVKAPLVGEEKISGRCGDKYEPQQIRYDEIFDKGDIVVNRGMNQKIMDIRPSFQINKPWHIDQAIQ